MESGATTDIAQQKTARGRLADDDPLPRLRLEADVTHADGRASAGGHVLDGIGMRPPFLRQGRGGCQTDGLYKVAAFHIVGLSKAVAVVQDRRTDMTELIQDRRGFLRGAAGLAGGAAIASGQQAEGIQHAGAKRALTETEVAALSSG